MSNFSITRSFRVPTLLLDESQCRSNIRRMVQKASECQIRLRPHCKTHQSIRIADWMREEGINCITVSSVTMARYFANSWNDITIAFPFNIHELETVNEMISQNQNLKLGLVVENQKAFDVLVKSLQRPVRIWIKVDAGYHRTGIDVENVTEILKLLNFAQTAGQGFLEPAGVLLHSGHTYNVRGMASIHEIHTEMLQKLQTLQSELQLRFPNSSSSGLEYSIGDTPSCSIMNDFGAATEFRPGNFVFYDVMQYFIGSNGWDQVAVVLACPVVAIHPDRNEIVIYGGSIHLSKDSIQDHEGRTIYGFPVSITEHSWDRQPWARSWVYKLSQEHGILKVPSERISQVQIGDWIGILPVHSCLTADCMGEYRTLTGQRLDHMRQHTFR